MNKSIWISGVIAFQILMFGVMAAVWMNIPNMDMMAVENWTFGFLITFVTLSYLYMGIEWGFGASVKPSEEEVVAVAFNRIDLNNDGRISREEAGRAGFIRYFDKFDTDRDGLLTMEEFHAAYTCGALHYDLLAKVKSFLTLGLAPAPSTA